MPSMQEKKTQGGVDFLERIILFLVFEGGFFFFLHVLRCPVTYLQIEQQLATKHHCILKCIYIF